MEINSSYSVFTINVQEGFFHPLGKLRWRVSPVFCSQWEHRHRFL